MATNDKNEARKLVQEKLRRMPHNDYQLASVTVRRRVYALLAEFIGGGTSMSVLSYRAASRWAEVDLVPLECMLPHIRFDYAPFDASAELPAKQYDIILVPLLGFNVEGFRLGHGGGWYDRLLSEQTRAYKIGAGLEANRIEFIHEQHDIPMDVLATESNYYPHFPLPPQLTKA